jgi:hypothetical protein
MTHTVPKTTLEATGTPPAQRLDHALGEVDLATALMECVIHALTPAAAVPSVD